MPALGLLVVAGLAAGCSEGPATPLSTQAKEGFLNSVYSEAPDIANYKSSLQLISLGQAICSDLASGAGVQEVADRVPLLEGTNAMPASDLGVVISSAASDICPRYHKLLSQ